MLFEIRFSHEAIGHLARLSSRYRSRILARIEAALRANPCEETRNLKRLRPNPIATYELRIGDYRAFFDVDDVQRVWVLAIGHKVHNRLQIGDEEVSL